MNSPRRSLKVETFSSQAGAALKWIVFLLNVPERVFVWGNLSRHCSETSAAEWEQPAGRAPHVWQAAAAAAKLASISALHNVPIISAMSEAHDEHLLRSRLHFMSLHYAALQAWDEDAEQRIADLAARGDSPLPSLSEGLFWIK